MSLAINYLKLQEVQVVMTVVKIMTFLWVAVTYVYDVSDEEVPCEI